MIEVSRRKKRFDCPLGCVTLAKQNIRTRFDESRGEKYVLTLRM